MASMRLSCAAAWTLPPYEPVALGESGSQERSDIVLLTELNAVAGELECHRAVDLAVGEPLGLELAQERTGVCIASAGRVGHGCGRRRWLGEDEGGALLDRGGRVGGECRGRQD